jgi:hypothetical protein
VSGRADFWKTGRIRSAAGRADFFFGLSNRCRAASGAQKFSFGLSGRCPLSFVSPRSKKNLFFCPVTSAQKCQGGRARRFFLSFGLSGRFRAAVSQRRIIFFLSSHIRAAVCSRKIIFFGPRSFFFCRPVSSAQNLLTFYGAWNLCSTPFQNPVSEI